ncbi:hypothetical protein AB0A70_04175 [Streptomyces morookaense]|uniref:hypothetical protein n=1 Tax=Streptomyces morookaense TaxID=1970 RepID=UPI003400EC7C
MLKLTRSTSTEVTVEWEGGDDPGGWLADAVARGYLENVLRALADPMELADVAADDPQAREQLRAVAWFLEQLNKRRDGLVVALKDRRDADPEQQAGASWTDLVRLIDPEEEKPLSKRSKLQRMYDSGRRRAIG